MQFFWAVDILQIHKRAMKWLEKKSDSDDKYKFCNDHFFSPTLAVNASIPYIFTFAVIW